MTDRIRLTFTRPVMHDNVHYEAGDCADVQRDMAQKLIACGAAHASPDAEPETAPDAEPETAPAKKRGGKK